MAFPLPERLKFVGGYIGAANAVAVDVVSCKNLHKVWFLIYHSGANDTDLVLTLTEYTAVGGSSATVTKTCPIWIDADFGTSSDTIARTTDAAALTIDPATQNGVFAIIEWDPSKHTDGYDCITLADSGGNASNTCAIMIVGESRFPGASLPTAIAD